MKKIAPPGRRASVKREAFKADDDIQVEEIAPMATTNTTTADANTAAQQQQQEEQERQRQQQEAEALAAAAARRQQAEADEARKRAEQEAEAARKKAVDEADAAAKRKAADEAEAAKRRAQEEEAAAARRRAAEEAESARRQEQDAAQQRKAAEEVEAARKREEEQQQQQQQAAAAAKSQAAAQEAPKRKPVNVFEEDEDFANIEAAAQQVLKKKADDEERRKREAEEATRRVAEAEELARRRAEEAEQQRIADEQAAARRKAEEEAAAQRKAAEEAEAARRKAAEEAEAARRKAAEEAAAQRKAAEEAEAARKKAEEEEAEAARRKAAEEAEAAIRKALEEEEAQKRAAEAEARRKAEEAEAARKAAEEAERLRREAEEADLRRKQEEELEEARRKAKEEADRRKRQEEEEAAEVARKAEEERKQAIAEAQAAATLAKEKEDAELEEKRRRAEEQRKKRANFLSDMDSFSVQFETQTQVNEETVQQANKKHEEIISNLAAKPEKQAEPARKVSAFDDDFLSTPKPVVAIDRSPVVAAQPPAAPAEVPAVATTTTGKSKDLIQDLTSSLFGEQKADARSMSPFGEDSAVVVVEPASPSQAQPDAQSVDEFRVPTRIGNKEKKADKKASGGASSPGPASTAVVTPAASSPVVTEHVRPASPSPVPSPTLQPPSKGVMVVEEDDEEEGTGELNSISNILTREERRNMTSDQKASWRAKQADLHTRRKEYHGAVTYMFDGIFSWQMYGSAEALDEYGNTYTEYLMRCQWGTTFENLQPWIVAHRYREFDNLDAMLKKQFPHMEKNMPKLPKKEMFRTMESTVIAKRRAVLEEYMSKVVESMPTLLRSELLNDFLRINERIAAIKNLLKLNTTVLVAPVHPEHEEHKAGHTHSHASSSTTAQQKVEEVEEEEEEFVMIWTVDDAEEVKEKLQSRPLDEDQMGGMEEDIRLFASLVKNSAPKELVGSNSKARQVLTSISKRWPSLRATCVVNMGVDFTLIPRAMQAEEDLVRFVNEFRSIETIGHMRR